MTDERRAHLLEMRALSTDTAGNEILVGLTVEQSIYVLQYGPDRLRGNRHTSDERDKYLVLHEKHEIARLQVLSAEIQLRNEKLPRN